MSVQDHLYLGISLSAYSGCAVVCFLSQQTPDPVGMETEVAESQWLAGSISLFVLHQAIVASFSRSLFPRTGVILAA